MAPLKREECEGTVLTELKKLESYQGEDYTGVSWDAVCEDGSFQHIDYFKGKNCSMITVGKSTDAAQARRNTMHRINGFDVHTSAPTITTEKMLEVTGFIYKGEIL